MKLFAYFDSLHISDDKFGKFLNEFTDNLRYTYIDSKNWEELTKTRNTKDKKVIEEKFIHLKKNDIKITRGRNIILES